MKTVKITGSTWSQQATVGVDHLVPDSGLEKEENNFCGGKPKPFLSSAKLLIVTVHKTLYVAYTCRLIAIIFVKVKVYP